MGRTSVPSDGFRTPLILGMVLLLTACVAPSLEAHEERVVVVPEGPVQEVPDYRPPLAEDRLVVCKPDSLDRIRSNIEDPGRQDRAERLLSECSFNHIQNAVNAVPERGYTIYVLPGKYREEPSRQARRTYASDTTHPCHHTYEEVEAGEEISYESQLQCPHAANLIAVLGDTDTADDTTADPSTRACNSKWCRLQIQGMGDDPKDVLLEGGFNDTGELIFNNIIRGDRAGGLYVRNLTVQKYHGNGIYVIETSGYALDRVLARWGEEYGILTFAQDYGLYKNCEAYGNGDAGLYPGTGTEIHRGQNNDAPLRERFSVEVKNCKSHHNVLGYSGTSGNDVWVHDNAFYRNATGLSHDSVFPDHPGMPQHHGLYEDNLIYRNNVNYYKYARDGTCELPPRDRGLVTTDLESIVLCPKPPVPVGTGMIMAGGNFNRFVNNHVFDNWRQGVMMFSVPEGIRTGESEDFDNWETSHYNHFENNTMGMNPRHSIDLTQPNGLDFWWAEGGEGNCWLGNRAADTDAEEDGSTTTTVGMFDDGFTTPTSDPDTLPPQPKTEDTECPSIDLSVDSPDTSLAPDTGKIADFAGCLLYDLENNPDPSGCPWFNTPPEPNGRESLSTLAALDGSGGGACLIERGGAPDYVLHGIRVLRDGVLSTAPGRWFTRLYYDL